MNKLENLSSERWAKDGQCEKTQVSAVRLMENIGLYTQNILAEQERMHKAIESLQDNNIKHMEETTP